MTFDELVTEVKDRLNLTSADANTRIGRAINAYYRRVTSSLGLQVARRVAGVQASTTLGSVTLTFAGIERIERIFDDRSGSIRMLEEVTYDQLRMDAPPTGDTPTQYAIETVGPSSVTVRINAVPQSVFVLKADGLETAATLVGSLEPQFSEDFHDVLVEGVLVDEYRKLERVALSKEAKDSFEQRLSELRFFLVKSNGLRLQQGGNDAPARGPVSSGGSGSTTPGTTSYTQSGLVTFDRGAGQAPFAVAQADAAMVANLDADKLDGLHATDIIVAAVTDANFIISVQVFS